MKKLILILAWVLGTIITSHAAEPPKVGEKAPLVEALDQDGTRWKLADQVGASALILYFYPKDDTPGCTKQACGLRDQSAELGKLGVKVVGISRDDAESHKAFRAKHGLSFPLLVDVDGKLTEAFGAAAPDRPRSRRISFLIDKAGKIVHVVDHRDAQVHLDELRREVSKLSR